MASPVAPVDCLEQTFLSEGVNASDHTFLLDVSLPGGLVMVITQVDATATGTEPTQLYFELIDHSTGAIFFHDSQSTGEGLGVMWVWRGAKPLAGIAGLHARMTIISGVSPTVMGCEIRGFYRPAAPFSF